MSNLRWVPAALAVAIGGCGRESDDSSGTVGSPSSTSSATASAPDESAGCVVYADPPAAYGVATPNEWDDVSPDTHIWVRFPMWTENRRLMILPDLPKSPADTNAVPLGVRVSGEYVPLSYERVRERRDDDQRFEGGTIFELTPVRPLPAGVEITILTVSAPFSMHRRCGDCPTGFTTTEGVLARFRTRADSGRDRLVWDGEIRFDTQERAPDRWRNHPFHELLASFGAFAPHMVLIWEGEFTPPMGQPNRWAFISGDVPRVSLQTGSAPDAVSLYLQAVDYTGRRGQTVWVQGTIQHPVARAWATAAWLVAASVFGLAVLLGFRARRKHASR